MVIVLYNYYPSHQPYGLLLFRRTFLGLILMDKYLNMFLLRYFSLFLLRSSVPFPQSTLSYYLIICSKLFVLRWAIHFSTYLGLSMRTTPLPLSCFSTTTSLFFASLLMISSNFVLPLILP